MRGPSEKSLTTVNKYISKFLRHAPHELGLSVQPGGWVPVDDLLEASCRHNFPIEDDELVECVESNDKRRFSFDASGVNPGQSGPQRRGGPPT